jgi:hypothetical protein
LSLRPPPLTTSLSRHCAGAPEPITIPPLRFLSAGSRLQVDKLLPRGRDAATQAAIKFSAAFRASRKLFLAGQPHSGECPLFSLLRCAPDHAASHAPRPRPPTLRRPNRVRAAGLSSPDPSGGISSGKFADTIKLDVSIERAGAPIKRAAAELWNVMDGYTPMRKRAPVSGVPVNHNPFNSLHSNGSQATRHPDLGQGKKVPGAGAVDR